MKCDTGLQIFLLVYSSLLTAIIIAFAIFLCCRKRSSKTVVYTGSPSRTVGGTRDQYLESGINADRVSISGNLYANVEEGRDAVYVQDERAITSNNVSRVSPSTPLSNWSRADGMFEMSELKLQDEVEENLYSSAKEETDSGDTNYEEVISVKSKERHSYSSRTNDPKEDDMLSTISSSSSSTQNSVTNQPSKPIATEETEDDNKYVIRNEVIYSNVEKKHSSTSSSASTTSTIQDNQKVELDQLNFKNSSKLNIHQPNNLDEEDPVALHFQIFNQESYRRRYNYQHDISRKSSSSSGDEKILMAALGPNSKIDSNQTTAWANQVFNNVQKDFENSHHDSSLFSNEESLKQDNEENQLRLPDMIEEPSHRNMSSSAEEEEEESKLKSHNMEPLNDTDSSSSDDYEMIKSMTEVENEKTEIHYQSSPSDNDEDPRNSMESSSDNEDNLRPSSSNLEKPHLFNGNVNLSTSDDGSSSDSIDSQSVQQVGIRNKDHNENNDHGNYSGSPLEHPKVTEIKNLERQNPMPTDSPVLMRQCTPVYHISSSSSSSPSDDDDDDGDIEEEPKQPKVQPIQIGSLRRSSSMSSSDDEISPARLQRHPVIDLRRSSSDDEQLHHNSHPRQIMNIRKSSSLTSDDEQPQQVFNIRRPSLSSSDSEKPQQVIIKQRSSSSSSSDEEQQQPQQNLQPLQVTNLRRSSSGSPSSIFQRLNYDYVSVYSKVEHARKKLRNNDYNGHDNGINELETDI